jgi:sugar fermentation stimulation protein A
MASCCEPGRTVYVSESPNPRRKLRYTWEMIAMPNSLVGVNTAVPNQLVRRAVLDEHIPELRGYSSVRSEAPYGRGSRVDLLLEDPARPPCYLEVKNCTLVQGATALFPDAVTRRGQKHLRELRGVASTGARAVVFFVVQRSDASAFRSADHIDPAFGEGLREAERSGVEVLVYDVRIDLVGVRLRRRLPHESRWKYGRRS